MFCRTTPLSLQGLVLLHGKSGTGKTSYIRYLITSIKKDVIFLPSSMSRSITDPAFISILAEKQNSVLVIEDAEDIVMDRETDGNSPVSALLNISDGLLADCLNIQIICTFNTDLSRVDNALLRKGRLIAQYEFRELEIDKAQQLSDKLGFNFKMQVKLSLDELNANVGVEQVFSHNSSRLRVKFLAALSSATNSSAVWSDSQEPYRDSREISFSFFLVVFIDFESRAISSNLLSGLRLFNNSK